MNALAQVSSEPQPSLTFVTVDRTAIMLADEGVPVRAIARSLKTPSDEVYEMLREAMLTGELLEMPKDDWPIGSKRGQRAAFAGTKLEDEEELKFACVRCFKVTPLEVSLLIVLLKRSQATKEQLYHAIKQSRAGPDRDELDPKMVDVKICHLRKKLTPKGINIETVWGIGYLISSAHRDKAVGMLNDAAVSTHG